MDSPLTQIEQQLDPFPTYAAMRRTHPIFFDPQRTTWNVFRYEDVLRVLSDSAAFSSQFGGDPGDGSSLFSASLISTDPPRHRALRSLVTQAFTPRAVEALAPRITQIVQEQLDQVSGGQMDAIAGLAYPLPVIVIAELLGIPSQDRERFKRWSDYAVQTSDFNDRPEMQRFNGREMFEMGQYFMQMIERRRQSPGEDLISGLLAANLEGQRLSQIELLGFCVLLLVAGNETTTNLIGNALLTFARQPELWASLRARPELLPQAIEEVLRYRSPVQAMFRVATHEVTLEGQVIPAHAPLIAWIGSANHDEAMFPEPEAFQIERSPNRHIAFGNGIHYCLGAPLARLEAKIALGAMLQRYASLTLAPGAQVEREASLIVYGLRSLPLLMEASG